MLRKLGKLCIMAGVTLQAVSNERRRAGAAQLSVQIRGIRRSVVNEKMAEGIVLTSNLLHGIKD